MHYTVHADVCCNGKHAKIILLKFMHVSQKVIFVFPWVAEQDIYIVGVSISVVLAVTVVVVIVVVVHNHDVFPMTI